MKNIVTFVSFLTIICYPSLSQIKINEVMYIPVNKEPEWIELINFQSKYVDSLELVISDPKGNFPFKIKDVNPYQYIVLVKDTNLLKKYRSVPDTSKLLEIKTPSLNNAGDSLVLRSKDGEIIDYFYFGKDFGKSGISLERINPNLPADNKENLVPSQSTDSATCGRINSKSFAPKDTSKIIEGLIINPNPFSPNSAKNKCNISITSGEYITNLSIKIYDTNGFKIKDLINTPDGDIFTKKQIDWDGTNNLGYFVQVGPYPVIIEYVINNTNERVQIKKIIVVGN